MYVPPEFREERVEVLHELIRAEPFAVLVTMCAGRMEATHLPIVLDSSHGAFGRLSAHVARGNSQWRDTDFNIPALVIFRGPHHYISPNWYPSRSAGGRIVPTWNYAVVHAQGRLRAVEDRDWLRRHVEELSAIHERDFPAPWSPKEPPPGYIDGMLKGIVGLEMVIEKLEGKWKMSQNRKDEDRAGAIAGLRQAGAADVASMVERCWHNRLRTDG